MTRIRQTARHKPLVCLAAILVATSSTSAIARPDREVASPIAVIDSAAIEDLPANRDMQAILDLHNVQRAAVGSNPLRWNRDLADGAQEYANVLAETGNFEHASLAGRGYASESLLLGPLSKTPPVKLAQVWANEQQFFTPGTFPNVCSSGDWQQCGHYTQMIWSASTDLGCGYARDQFVALVCRYSPHGNMIGQQVLGVPPNIIAGGPVINIGNPPQVANAPDPKPEPTCSAPEPDDFIALLNEAALRSGFGLGAPQEGDATTTRQWRLALEKEQDIQNQLMSTLASQSGDVAKHINDYLQATSAWQGTYNYILSSSTGLQALLTNWLEAREIYAKADFAFALANLGVGGVKLGFKAYKFFTTRGAASAEAAAAGASTAAGAADDALAAGARASDEAGALAAGETQAFNRTIVPPGQNPNVPGFRGYTGASSASGPTASAASAASKLDNEIAMTRRMLEEAQKSGAPQSVIDTFKGALDDLLQSAAPAASEGAAAARTASSATSTAAASAAQVAEWERQVAKLTNEIADIENQGLKFLAEQMKPNLDALIQAGPQSIKILTEAEKTTAAVASLDARLVAAARQAGVNVDEIARAAANAQAGDTALMRAIALSRGWHGIPTWVDTAVQNVLLQARRVMAGVDGASIPVTQLQQLRALKAAAEARGLNFADWLSKSAGSVEAGIVTGESTVSSAIVRYFDDADISLLLKVLDAGEDAVKLRNAVSPVAQALANGLARGQQPIRACGDLGEVLALQGTAAAGMGPANVTNAANASTPPAGASAPGANPSDAQLENVLYGQGKLGEVGLGNVIDQFGVTDRFTAGQSYGRAVLGELWELFTSPSQTTASFYYTMVAQDEMLNLLQNGGDKLVQLGTQLGDASRALENLQNTLRNAGLSDRGFLGKQGPDELRKILEDLEKVYDSASDDWKRRNREQIDERRAHINQKLADLAETVADLNALTDRLGLMRAWLDSLRYNSDGSLRGPVDLFNPILHVRLGSIATYLRGVGADAFGLTSEAPFTLVPPAFEAPPRATQPANVPEETFEEMKERLEEKWREFEEAEDVDIDPELEAWLNSLE